VADDDWDLVELKVRVPRELVLQCLESLPDDGFIVRRRAEATLLMTSIRIAVTPPDPAELLYDLQQEQEARHQREFERRQYRLDAASFDEATLERLYPPSRLAAMWLADEREGRKEPPLEPWEHRPLLRIRAYALELQQKRRRGIEAAREMLGVR
jgi:hypothetical protein